MTRSSVLFGSESHPWRASDFRAVDDRIRGGSSTSHLNVEKLHGGTIFARFWGHLDTHTLGGAGFASQACLRAFDLESYDGIRLRILPSPVAVAAGGKAKHPTSFTLNVKTSLPEKRPDGRNESVVVYELPFSTIPPISSNTTFPESSLIECIGRWDQFEPTYRGRPAKDAPKLDPSSIEEISIMCRSNFDAQEGDFELRIIDIYAISLKRNLTERMRAWLSMLWQWYLGIFSIRKRGRDGHIRL